MAKPGEEAGEVDEVGEVGDGRPRAAQKRQAEREGGA